MIGATYQAQHWTTDEACGLAQADSARVRLVRHARRLVFQLAEVALSRNVFWQVLERIDGLHPAPG